MPAITVDRLTKRYGELTAVDALSFEVRSGAVTGFLGPNGAGKTTTIRMLLGLARPSEGTALINGSPYAELADPIGTVGTVLEGGLFHPGRSGRDHLRVLATANGVRPERVDDVLELVGLDMAADKRIGGYSMGMRQRLGLASALLGEPEILILDEPANGLDPAGIRWLRSVMREFAEAGGTVLVSSHLLAEVAQAVDDVVVIGHGRCLAQGPIDELVSADASLEDVYLDLTGTTEVLR